MILKAFRSKIEKEDEATGDDGTSQNPSIILFPFLHVTLFSGQWDVEEAAAVAFFL